MKKQTKIEWAKYVDRIFCVYYLPNKARMPRLTEELDRVGILSSGIFEWRFTVPSPYDHTVQKSFSDKTWITNIGCINGALEQLRIFQESLLLGYKRILILEDDVAFLKDLDRVRAILDALPQNFDVVQLDKGFGDPSKVREWESIKGMKINEHFIDSHGHCFGFSTANIYNTKGMELATRKLSTKPIAVDQMNRDGSFQWAVAKENACIQIFYGNSNFNNDLGCHYVYTSVGIDYGRYNIPEGYNPKVLYNPYSSPEVLSPVKDTKKNFKPQTSMWDIFDYIGVVCYTGYHDRLKELLPELERVGLKDKVHLHWDCPSIFRDRLFESVGKTRFCSRVGCFNMTVGHYTLIKTAYELGCNSVLVMEDDMRFLKDISSIAELLDSIPQSYDHLMLDRNRLTTTDLKEFVSATEEQRRNKWIEFDESGSTGCYAMSRRGMARYLQLIEIDVKRNLVHNPDHYFRGAYKGQIYWDSSYHRYFCYPNIAVQSIAGKHGSFSDLSSYWGNLSPAGIKPEDYNISIPVVTEENYYGLLEDYIHDNPTDENSSKSFCSNNLELLRCMEKSCTSDTNKGESFGRCYLWGMDSNEQNRRGLQVALRDKAKIYMCEIGLIHTEGKKKYSVVIDDKGCFYDMKHITRLEEMIDDYNLTITAEQRVKARRLINKIVGNKISTYNEAIIKSMKIGQSDSKKVLLVDQVCIPEIDSLGMVDNSTFSLMLKSAMEENPDADIIIKSHHRLGDNTKNYYQDVKQKGRIYKIDDKVNPYCLFDICDKVYVGNSLMGFEALLAGKEVHTFGMPFYAGWGLTIDAQHLERRTNMRTIEELFYIYCFMYTHWVDPDKGCETTIDAVIDKMIELREAYQKNYHKASIVSRTQNAADDGFGYNPSPIVRFPRPPLNPVISTRSSPMILPRIDTSRRGYSNW